MTTGLWITPATREDTPELAAIHIAARREAMSYLPALHTDEETLDWFVSRVAEVPEAFWVARNEQQIVGYLVLYDVYLDDLYVRPGYQRRGVGSAQLEKAKSLSPHRLELSTFEQNTPAQAFYEARGFREIGRTAGQNQERMPDIQYEWMGKG